ncbi:uncharacterized protein TNCT_565052 [Trichonephila clavata]|uniref:Gag-like protein n=1 Tax=Trichonephila clavata TaxID=2740835 RepID=A0A8X6GTW8_TRICU|nr:uncharacterized protein TNCT_565052 [Trichonephila clavata]
MTSKELTNATFFVIRRTESDTFASVSPFLIQKGLAATVGSVKAVSKMRSGDLMVEVNTTKQVEQLLSLQMLSNIPVTISPHANLNFSRGVISESDLYNVPEEEILEGLREQKVCEVRRITIRRDGQIVKTKHLIFTFACPDLPQTITAGYLRCSVRPEVGHDSAECTGQENCINCKGDHPSYSRSCKTWTLEKEIISVKIKNKLTYPEARLAVTNRTPIQGLSYAAAAKKKSLKASTTQKNPIAREADSLYESSPVSKRSRRRKTFPASDAMDTDVNPSDTDYVIGQASEEDESLLEANFKQAAPDPSPKK